MQGISAQYISEKPDLGNYRQTLIAGIAIRGIKDYSMLYPNVFDIGLFRIILAASNKNLT